MMSWASSTSGVENPAIIHRPRRLRRTAALRRLVQETQLTVDDLIYPLFVMEGEAQKQEIPSIVSSVMTSIPKRAIGVGNVGKTPGSATYTLYNPDNNQIQFKTLLY